MKIAKALVPAAALVSVIVIGISVGSMATQATAPSQITDLSVGIGTTGMLLQWSAPGNGGSAITGYSVEITVNNGTATTSSTTSNHFVHEADTAGTNTYKYRVLAVNAVGNGLWSSAVTVTTPNS